MAKLGPGTTRERDGSQAGELAVVIMMMTTVLALYLPGHLRTLPLLAALVYIWLNRQAVTVDSALKIWATLFVCYLATFSLLAENMPTAWKGTYDILRGCLYFFAGYFFGIKLQVARHYPWLLLILVAVLAGSFLSYQEFPAPVARSGGFYGYHANPNNSAFVVVVVLAFVLPSLFPPRISTPGLLTGAAGTGIGLLLLYHANSRGAWLAVFLGLSVLTITSLRNNRSLLVPLVSVQASLLAAVLFYFNWKGFSMPVRLDAWTRLIEVTVKDHVWLGHGINNTKEVLLHAGSPVLIAHNLFVDIFVSTGIVGSLAFCALCIGLVLILARNGYSTATAFNIGLCGLVMFGMISLFDLKFASLTLTGTLAFFTGVVYSRPGRTAARIQDSR